MRERDTLLGGFTLMERMTLFSPNGTKFSFGAWTVALISLFVLMQADLGPGAWLFQIFSESMGRFSMRLTAIPLNEA